MIRPCVEKNKKNIEIHPREKFKRKAMFVKKNTTNYKRKTNICFLVKKITKKIKNEALSLFFV